MKQYISQYWTSYKLANMFFPKEIRKDVITLYAFVRVPDNIVDNKKTTLAEKKILFDRSLKIMENVFSVKEVESSFDWEVERVTICKEMKKVKEKYDLKQEWLDAFFNAMEQDLYKTHYNDYQELQLYMYGSAEVIWLMMTKVIGYENKDEKEVFRTAKLLWEAMQYTNFLRDVLEDWKEHWRIYLPESRLIEHWITHWEIISICEWKDLHKQSRSNFVKSQIKFLREIYKEANTGIDLLKPQGRKAVRFASHLYEAILDKIEAKHYDVFHFDVHTSKYEKVIALINAWQKMPTLSLHYLYKLSRPRFWLYIFWPFLIAWIAWHTQWGVWLDDVKNSILWAYSDPRVQLYTVVTVLFFSFVANLIIYGVNDYADWETDRLNEKKGSYEIRFDPKYKPQLKAKILWWSVPSILVVWYITVAWGFMTLIQFCLAMWWFLFFGVFYSLPPIRAKAIPFVDSIFNVLYQFSALFGWALAWQSLTDYSLLAWLAWWLWMMARHTFSAIPDIKPDSDAWIKTTATILWENWTLLYCFTLWLASFLLFFPLIGRGILPWVIVFCWFCLASYITKNTYKIYKMIPWLVPFLGTFYFWYLIFI